MGDLTGRIVLDLWEARDKVQKGSIYSRIQREDDGGTTQRMNLLGELSGYFENRQVISYYTSFVHDVMIDDRDIAPFEDLLNASDLEKGLLLVISSPGGSGLASERIINLCRQYSGGNFSVLVPKQAKSAATMICLGAERIYMSPTSELGPIDPQVPEVIGSSIRYVPADLVINSYEKLFAEAVATSGRIEPFLQQLQDYDARLIALLKREQSLGVDIAVKALKDGMMKEQSIAAIRRRIRHFVDASVTSSHGRPILASQAKECGLNVEALDIHSSVWEKVMEYHFRADSFVSDRHAKLIESGNHSFSVGVRRSS